MSLSAKLQLKQSQQLVMTPQLQQAIKLLQLSNFELTQFVESELERNPLLERDESTDAETEPSRNEPTSENRTDVNSARDDASGSEPEDSQDSDSWTDLGARASDPSSTFDTEIDNVYPDTSATDMQVGLSGASNWSQSNSATSSYTNEGSNLESYVAGEVSLRDHLTEQLPLVVSDPAQRLIGKHLIDLVDDAGYLTAELSDMAERLGAPLEVVEGTLDRLQTCDPPGVFARSLGESLALQLKEQNRYDPQIASLLDNLHLLGAHDLAGLKKAVGVSMDELSDMISEIKGLSPKPGLKFGSVQVQPAVPDVLVSMRNDGSFNVELNSDTLPRVLVNRSYFTRVSKSPSSDKDKVYLNDCLQNANWLVKSLDQRARTILKVAEEIVRQQDGFFTHGVQHLRPLNLKTVAQEISMHESTVSRVTSNKYIATSRGIFEMKYFFTSAIPASGAGEAHSSESVRFRIKELIAAEVSNAILSDDKIVDILKGDGIDIARRTVAKYREAMGIRSSVHRRREKRMSAYMSG